MFFACFGDDYHAAADWFGVTIRTIYRWLEGNKEPPLMAKKLLTAQYTGILSDVYPCNQWKIKDGRLTTPFGSADVYEFEQFPAYRARYLTADRRVNELQLKYERLLKEVDQLVLKIEQIKRLRCEFL